MDYFDQRMLGLVLRVIGRAAIDACVSAGVFERSRVDEACYSAFCDPSGGFSVSMTLAIAHRENGVCVFDAVRERKPPFSPDDVVEEFAATLRSYGITHVLRDRYAGEWARSVPIGRHHLRSRRKAEERPVSGQPASDQQQKGRSARPPAPDKLAPRVGTAHGAAPFPLQAQRTGGFPVPGERNFASLLLS
ncbi:hypothetical protein [Rhodopseudomonas pseudopalustris]|uniref:hypothetical protein n=1 Tax=Rhodopseudomonas pseudopalustris TaxID=1513892 RepID=UPI001113AE6F|nr:hypothetical protein [Rhodopseudomonas pseudopalustris]